MLFVVLSGLQPVSKKGNNTPFPPGLVSSAVGGENSGSEGGWRPHIGSAVQVITQWKTVPVVLGR